MLSFLLSSFVLFYDSFSFAFFLFIKLVGNAQIQLQIPVHDNWLSILYCMKAYVYTLDTNGV